MKQIYLKKKKERAVIIPSEVWLKEWEQDIETVWDKY